MQSFWDWFRALNDATGINLTIFYDSFDRRRFVSGFLMTLGLSAICIVASVLIGIVGAWLQGSRLRADAHASSTGTSSFFATRRRWSSSTSSTSASAAC